MSIFRNRTLPALLLATAMVLPAAAGAAEPTGILASELAEARREVRQELASARAELDRENLQLGSMSFGKGKARKDGTLPRGEITPHGDLLIDGKAVAVDAAQRRELLHYRRQVIDVAKAGIDIGERGAQAALDVVDRGLFRLIASALTGTLEKNLERTIKAELEPAVTGLCQRLPDLMATQQRLQASVPEFGPYATLEADDVKDCADQVRREFALN